MIAKDSPIVTSNVQTQRLDRLARNLDPVRRLLLGGTACLVVMLMLVLTGCDTVALPTSVGLSGENAAAGGVPAASGSPTVLYDESRGAAAALDLSGEIDEGDIVKIVGSTLYALNRFKGLLLVDVTDPAALSLLGRLDLRGCGVEMYVSNTRVVVLLSSFNNWGWGVLEGVADAPVVAANSAPGSADVRLPSPEFEGSQLAIVDVTDPSTPVLDGKLNLAGFANDSRRVGDIIYVVGSNLIPWDALPAGSGEEEDFDEGFVASVNIADADNIVPVDRKTFSGDSLAVHVSQTTLFAASHVYDFEAAQAMTRVQVADISDPAGAIAIRGTFDVPGRIGNRFYMDDYAGALRIATESWGFGFQEVRLFTYDLTDLDHVIAMGQADIIQGESLRAVRFDGPRGYVVTFEQVDPLFVLDLQDPAHPAGVGTLEVPGFSTHIEPRGDRLIAVGIDDTDGRRPAVAYYDVADPANPAELGRVILGPPGTFADSEAVYDEKAFKVVDELGLIVIPFKHVDLGSWIAEAGDDLEGEPAVGEDDQLDGAASYPTCVNAVQLVDFDDTALTQRGWFEHRGAVQRVGAIGDRIFALSQISLQTVDLADRDDPVQLGRLDFFEEDEMPWFADDCAGWFGPVVMPDGLISPSVWDLLRAAGACGTTSLLPLAATLGCLLCRARLGRSRRPS